LAGKLDKDLKFLLILKSIKELIKITKIIISQMLPTIPITAPIIEEKNFKIPEVAS